MMSIGTFAQTTGLTVKALHLYDERGILTPAEVDERSGYRRYAPSQVRAAASISVLRAMGVSLEDVERWLSEPDGSQALLDQRRAELVRERERQDRIWEEGCAVLAAYDVERPVLERSAPERPWLAVTAPIEATDDDADGDERFEAAVRAAHDSGVAATGPFWTAFRTTERDGELETVLAIGLDASVPVGAELGAGVLTGVLPERTERYVLVDPGFAVSTEIAAPHPGVVSLFEAIPDAPVDGIRQTIVTSADGGLAIELVLDAPSTERSTP